MDALTLGGAGACALRIPQLRERLLSRLPALSALVLMFVPGGRCPDACSGSAARGGVGALLTWAPLRSCGIYSYAMYVFHGLLHKLVGEPWLVATFGERPSV
jgi:hypothetical protein